MAANSTNTLLWLGTTGWTSLPFEGFNGPVTSITKLSTGHILFGGQFSDVSNVSGFSNVSLNGLFEYDPAIPWGVELHASAINDIGNHLSPNATINQTICSGEDTYIGGGFTGQNISNIFVLKGNKINKLSGG